MNARSRLLASFAAAALAACRTAASPPVASLPSLAPAAAAAVPEIPIELTLRVEAVTKGGRSSVDSDDALRSGDRLALYVGLSEPAYVYVGLRASDGTPSVLFPSSASQEIVAAGVEQRIPRAGWFKLDEQTGQEDLFLYASRRLLTREEALDLVKAESAARRAPPQNPPPQPPAQDPTPQEPPPAKPSTAEEPPLAVTGDDTGSASSAVGKVAAADAAVAPTLPPSKEEAVASASDDRPARPASADARRPSKRPAGAEGKSALAERDRATAKGAPDDPPARRAAKDDRGPRPSALLAYAPAPLTQNDRGLQLVTDAGVEVQADAQLTRAHLVIRHTR